VSAMAPAAEIGKDKYAILSDISGEAMIIFLVWTYQEPVKRLRVT
jgi:hypothetical protein